MFNKLKQFKDLRSQAKDLQSKLAEESVTIKKAGDSIVLTMDGNLTVTGLAIDEALLSKDKQEKLQTELKEAFNDAVKKIQRIMAVKMKEMGGLPNIPGLN
ncbi:MAG TPA: nucleoid-associated protein, YbaB/EbfC family [Candidatus Magasanikbacteria bacterium]|nr:MAG: nucleoid-associated protein, YbaB/EbfC family [Candidatus Magasanikbacteria bacterium RIFCSPLOWO2_02_FULL_47_16]OGH79735.1 MAG: nucleoid-associated protein, YbaB/EbfC family [Candidatus Magasanikbacteria bacterium RIFCSPHIGHO2_02_FULL_48_18]OGH82287.1 MAG: nucleoid-associated protein, YbaB/EbfC family [Candidatus Magasanikbacteria bacterium RIFCSPLOWO2_12_FULL_47_9b]HAZ28179.1 nucleoid-associated protein, YbaB/EbfC family [Candidatus Magasanikbacteria bacterium]